MINRECYIKPLTNDADLTCLNIFSHLNLFVTVFLKKKNDRIYGKDIGFVPLFISKILTFGGRY